MIKAVQYIKTGGDEEFKEFLSQPFTFEMLSKLSDTQQQVLFDGWRVKDMNHWQKYINDEQVELEVYPDRYTIKTHGVVGFVMKRPATINDFLLDMERYGVKVFWTRWIDENFEPKQYLEKNEIEKYYRDRLKDMGKSHELL